jgi:hypothetical protein
MPRATAMLLPLSTWTPWWIIPYFVHMFLLLSTCLRYFLIIISLPFLDISGFPAFIFSLCMAAAQANV